MSGWKFKCIEGVIRSLAVVGGAGAGVAGGFTLHQLLIIFQTTIPLINEPLETPLRAYDAELILYTQISIGLAIGLAILGLFVAVSIILRCCTCEGTKMKIARRVTHGIDIVVILLCLLGFGAGGVIGALGASSWSNLVAQIDMINPFLNDYLTVFDELKTTIIATAATSLLASVFHVVLLVWMIAFMARNCSTMEYKA